MSTALREWTGAEIRDLRAWMRLPQKDFADRMGVAQEMVSRWENGHYHPQARYLRKLDDLAREAGFDA